MIAEHDLVVLTRDLPEHGLVVGDVATVVMIHREGEGYTLEFSTVAGDTLAIATVHADAVRPCADRDVFHARVAAA